MWFLKRFIHSNIPIYLTGASGTGKTMIFRNALKEMEAKDFISLELSLSYHTQSKDI